MANDFTNLPAFKKLVQNRLKLLQKKAASDLMATFFDTVCNECPVEDGHGHEAFMTCMQELSGELSGPRFNQVVRAHVAKRSGDVSASQASMGVVGEAGGEFIARVSIKLPFLRKLDRGLLIRVGDRDGNTGPKVNPVIRPPGKGALYASRASKGTFGGLTPSGRTPLSRSDAAMIRKGVGLLVWSENGSIRRALVRRPRAYGFWRKGMQAVRKRARQLGLKPA